MAVEIRILGQLEVVTDGVPLNLRGRAPRALLALLVLRAGELVPSHVLHDALWPGASPATAARNLKANVYSLRQILGDHASLVATRPGGYELAIESEQLDARRFERLLGDGTRALAAGDAALSAEILRRALALWRGPVLADLSDEAFVEAAGARLEELRLTAVEERIEADLALGRCTELVAELEALAAAEPLRERPQRQLMLALYRSGRQVEALDVYSRFHAHLRELGLEPTPGLRALQTAMLRQDPALAVASPGVRVVRRLPARATPLIGRHAELDQVQRLVTEEGVRLLTLTGPGGVGKSRLALEAAHELGDGFPGGAVFVGLASLGDAALVAEVVAEELEGDALDGASPARALGEQLRERRILLLLDNFEHVTDAAPFVSELLAAAPGLTVLVTSRTPLRLYGEFELAVPPLRLEEAIPLFSARARAAGATLDREPLVAELCRRLDCLPLAIELAAARSRDLSSSELLSMFGEPLELATGGPSDAPARHQTLRATIAWSVERSSADEQALFRRLAVFAGGFEANAAAEICEAPRGGVLRLAAGSLLDRRPQTDPPRFAMLETIRDYAREQLEQHGESARVRERHARFFLALAEEAEHALLGGADRGLWLDRMAAEHDNLRAALAWAHADAPELELRLAAALRLFWELRGHLREGRTALSAALARPGDHAPDVKAKALNAAAVLAYRQGDLAATEGFVRESLALHRELGDQAGIARALGELGNVAAEQREHERAIALYEECAALLRSVGDDTGLAVALANLGDVAFKEGELGRAAELLRESIALQRQTGDRDSVAAGLFTLGRVVFTQGDNDGAVVLLGESLEISTEIGYRECTAYCLAGLAHVALATGDAAEAAALFASADALFEEIGARMQQFERDAYETAVAAARHALGEERFVDAWTTGRARDASRGPVDGRASGTQP
jgi:predicted ATPase/DNA-binding SARP family transcriptional activator